VDAPLLFHASSDDWGYLGGSGGFGGGASYSRTGNVLTGGSNTPLWVADARFTGISYVGYQLGLGDTLLVRESDSLDPGFGTVGEDAGIYECTQVGGGGQPWKLTRRADADTTGELVQFNKVRSRGDGTQWFLDTVGPITINTTDQDWQPFKFYPSEHAPSHLPSGTDPLDTGTPVAVGTANAEGTADSFARSDHVHAPLVLEGTQKDCGADMTVGTSAADVNNLTYTVGTTGTYLVTFNLDVNCTTAGGAFIGSINVNGADVRSAVYTAQATNYRVPVSLARRVSITAGQIVKVMAVRVSGGYTIEADNSSMTVQRVA